LIQLDPSNELPELGFKPIIQPLYYNFHHNCNFIFISVEQQISKTFVHCSYRVGANHRQMPHRNI